MSQYNNSYAQTGSATRTGVAVDQGLRSYMLGVYNYMAAGVALTGLVAYAMHAAAFQNGRLTEFGAAIYKTPLQWVVMLAPLGIVIYLGVRAHRMSATWAQGVFWLYAAAVGASVSFILMKYTGNSVARTFFISAAAFAGLSAYGYVTKRDLTGLGTFLVMGLIGIIIAAIVNIFLQSSALQFAISCIGLLIFAGFTAYDTQNIKDQYYQVVGDVEAMAKSSIFGALALYQDFVGIFMNLLQLTGDRE
jgi:FtsH-binding integral membrane protein